MTLTESNSINKWRKKISANTPNGRMGCDGDLSQQYIYTLLLRLCCAACNITFFWYLLFLVCNAAVN